MSYTLLYRKLHFGMVSIQVLRDCTSCFKVWTALETDGESLNFSKLTSRYRCDETTVQATREKESYIPVSIIDALMNCTLECVTNLFVIPSLDVLVHCPVPIMVAHKVIDVRVIYMTRGNTRISEFRNSKALASLANAMEPVAYR